MTSIACMCNMDHRNTNPNASKLKSSGSEFDDSLNFIFPNGPGFLVVFCQSLTSPNFLSICVICMAEGVV